MNPLARLLLVLCFCGALLGSSQADTDSARTTRLVHKLQNLPYGHTPGGTVYRLLIELTQRNPIAAYNYFLAGYPRISPSVNQEATIMLLAKSMEDIVDRSNLSLAEKSRITRRFSRFPLRFVDTWYPPASPTPTPTPSPTP